MPYIAKPIDRDQVMIMTFDSLVECNSIARVIDHFVNNIDLAGMGFKNAVPSFEGRPGYPAECMVKLYLYGYRKNIRSSRKLEAACSVNLEVIWLMGGLKPDFRTISDFRKDNIDCVNKVYKEFVKRVTIEMETGFVSIDGSKFKAWNSKDRNFTVTKLDDRIQWLEDHSEEYLRQMEIADENDETVRGSFTRAELEEKLKETQERLARYKGYRDLMERENLSQLSLTDADCRLMKNKNGMDTAYNVQTAVDSETHLMVDYQMTNRVTDHGLLEPTAEGIKAEAGDRILEKGIIPNVVLPDGRDVYELEIAYEEATCDRESGRRRDKKVSACRDRAGSI